MTGIADPGYRPISSFPHVLSGNPIHAVQEEYFEIVAAL
jgi:hypothetical protein